MDIRLDYWISTEKHTPEELLDYAVAAERAGFDAVWFDDHFLPYWHEKAQNGMAWIILASAAERTKNIKLGTAVTSCLNRYHPAIVAQTFATLGAIHPSRIMLALGAGCYVAQIPFLDRRFPTAKDRLKNLVEAAEVINALWSSEEYISYEGEHYELGLSKLYTKPESKVPLYWSSFSPRSAEYTGKLADGWITIYFPKHYPALYNLLMDRLEKGAQKVDKNFDKLDKLMFYCCSYAPSEEEALKEIMETGAFRFLPKAIFNPLPATPLELQELITSVTEEDVFAMEMIVDKAEGIIAKYESFIKHGFNRLGYFEIGNPNYTLELFSKEIIPYFKDRRG